MYPQQGQLGKGLPHCTQLRELELELGVVDTVRHAGCVLDMSLLVYAVSLEECLC